MEDLVVEDLKVEAQVAQEDLEVEAQDVHDDLTVEAQDDLAVEAR